MSYTIPSVLVNLYNSLSTRTLNSKNLSHNFFLKSLLCFLLSSFFLGYSIYLFTHSGSQQYKFLYSSNSNTATGSFSYDYNTNILTSSTAIDKPDIKQYPLTIIESNDYEFFLGLSNFQQNNLYYTKNFNLPYNKSLRSSEQFYISEYKLVYPNGVASYTFNNDYIKLYKNKKAQKLKLNTSKKNSHQKEIQKLIKETDTQLSSDNTVYFNNIRQYINNTDQKDFLNSYSYNSWTKFSAFPYFYKKIAEAQLDEGEYEVKIFDKYPFGEKKFLLIKQKDEVEKNERYKRATGVVVVGVVMFLIGVFYFTVHNR